MGAKSEQLSEAESAKAELAEKTNQLQLQLFQKESEFKTLKQEYEQNEIKIKTLIRTQEDEKSKANALKASEEKLTTDVADRDKEIDGLKSTKT